MAPVQLYVDLDGVLADFAGGCAWVLGRMPNHRERLRDDDWDRLRTEFDFYARLQPMPDAMQLWQHVKVHDPVILTGLPLSMPQAEPNKRAWVAKHLGPEVRVICCLARDKCKRAVPGDILIDDWPKYQHLWEAAGGVWIAHTSAADTIKQLQERGL